MKVIIHSCDKRMWYVQGYLVPALREQGVESVVHNDNNHRGNLWAYIDSFHSIESSDAGTWHLEDDVYPCRDFVPTAMANDEGIIHGFFHRYNRDDIAYGWISATKPGYSFPCIRIPDRLAVEFAEWFLEDARHRDQYSEWVRNGKNIDSFWENFLKKV